MEIRWRGRKIVYSNRGTGGVFQGNFYTNIYSIREVAKSYWESRKSLQQNLKKENIIEMFGEFEILKAKYYPNFNKFSKKNSFIKPVLIKTI